MHLQYCIVPSLKVTMVEYCGLSTAIYQLCTATVPVEIICPLVQVQGLPFLMLLIPQIGRMSPVCVTDERKRQKEAVCFLFPPVRKAQKVVQKVVQKLIFYRLNRKRENNLIYVPLQYDEYNTHLSQYRYTI